MQKIDKIIRKKGQNSKCAGGERDKQDRQKDSQFAIRNRKISENGKGFNKINKLSAGQLT